MEMLSLCQSVLPVPLAPKRKKLFVFNGLINRSTMFHICTPFMEYGHQELAQPPITVRIFSRQAPTCLAENQDYGTADGSVAHEPETHTSETKIRRGF